MGGGVQICEGGSISACDRDDVSSHLMYYQLFSENLEYELILFRSSLGYLHQQTKPEFS